MTPATASTAPVSNPTAAAAPGVKAEREQLAAASQAFEAIFVRQMLNAARKTDFGDPLLGGQALDTFRQMQDDRFADIAAESGAFGLAKIIEAQLAMHLPPPRLHDAPDAAANTNTGRGI